MLTLIRSWFGRDTEWDHHAVDRDRPVTLLDGSKATGWVWRRRVDGQWQFKAMTPEEAMDAEKWDAVRGP